jgi:signal transduction histidine kinase
MTTTCYRICALFVLSLNALVVQAFQPDTLFLNGSEVKTNLLPTTKVFSTSSYLSPSQALETINQQGKTITHATIGFTRETYWGAFIIKNSSQKNLTYILELESPQIDCLQVYTFSPLTIAQWALTGDAFPFHYRMIPHRNYVFPIALLPGEQKSFLLKIEKRNSSLNFPLHLWSEAAFYQNDAIENLGYGLYFGLILLCALYSILVFGFLRSPIYLWYFIWVVSSGLFVSTALGFSQQFLYPNAHDANSIFRVIIQVINLVAFLKFSQKFLQMETYTPRLGNAIHYIALFITAITLPVPFKPAIYYEYSHILLPFLNWLMVATLILIVSSAVKSFKHQRVIIIYYFAAFSALIAGAFCVVGIEFGVFAAEDFSINPFLAGSSLEYLIFSVGITYQIKKVFDERNNLTLKFAQQQKELLKAYVDGVEKERERISRELHDDIGSRLSTLNRFVTIEQSDTNLKLQEQIEHLCEDVRNMSHQLAPASLKMTGLKSKVFELATELEERKNIKVDIQFYDFPETLNEEQTIHLYRILQEAFNNIAKHADASLVDLQFFGHDDELVVTLEDNGKGFKASTTNGIGVQNMQARAASIQGVLEISSQPGKGTQLLLRVPRTNKT